MKHKKSRHKYHIGWCAREKQCMCACVLLPRLTSRERRRLIRVHDDLLQHGLLLSRQRLEELLDRLRLAGQLRDVTDASRSRRAHLRLGVAEQLDEVVEHGVALGDAGTERRAEIAELVRRRVANAPRLVVHQTLDEGSHLRHLGERRSDKDKKQ